MESSTDKPKEIIAANMVKGSSGMWNQPMIPNMLISGNRLGIRLSNPSTMDLSWIIISIVITKRAKISVFIWEETRSVVWDRSKSNCPDKLISALFGVIVKCCVWHQAAFLSCSIPFINLTPSISCPNFS